MKEIPLFPTFIQVTQEHKDEYHSYLRKLPKVPCNALFMTLIIYDNDDEQIKLSKLNGLSDSMEVFANVGLDIFPSYLN